MNVFGGSSIGKAKNIERARVIMDERMHLDYFCDEPVWGLTLFRQLFHMKRSLFLTILERVCVRDPYFVQKTDACSLLGLSSRQNMTATLRIYSLGVCVNTMDVYCRTSESTAMEYMKRFCSTIRYEFGEHYLRQPTEVDFEQQLTVNAVCGFFGIFGSLDYIHYEWNNSPMSWQG